MASAPTPLTIVVTGSGGFLGTKLCDSLKSRGHTITTFDYTDGQNILDVAAVEKAFQDPKPDACIHLAAVADLNFFRKDAAGCELINVQGTTNIMDACLASGARMLFASTCCCYGNNNCHPSDETSPLAPTEPYAKSKQTSEAAITAAGLPHTSLRLATFYGPGMRPALCPAVFIEKAMKGEDIVIHGDGKQTRTFTYVEDVVSGIVAVTEGEAKFSVVNISTEEVVSVLEIAAIVKGMVPEVVITHGEDRKGQIFKESISSARLQSFGWKPQTNFVEGMALSMANYKANNGWTTSVGVSGGDAANVETKN